MLVRLIIPGLFALAGHSCPALGTLLYVLAGLALLVAVERAVTARYP